MDEEKCKAQTFAADTTCLISREEESLSNFIQYTKDLKLISGLVTNLDKTNVIPFGKYFNPENKIYPEL